MQNIASYIDFKQKSDKHDGVALLLYNPENELSQCAFRSVKEASYSDILAKVVETEEI